ncbi:MAG: hypothetical protein ACR2MQ_03360 [Gemmatimonadaceae bacterium]
MLKRHIRVISKQVEFHVAILVQRVARLSVAALLVTGGCHTYTAAPSTRLGVTRASSGPIQVTRTDHSVVPLKDADIVRDSLIGTANDGSNTRIAIPLRDITAVATREVDAGRSLALGGGVGLGAIGVFFILLVVVISSTNWQ